MREYIHNVADEIIFTMHDSNGNLEAGLSGLSAEISKNGGSFSAVSGAISEIGRGYYKVASGTTNLNTVGQGAIYAWKPGTSYRGGTKFIVKPRRHAGEVYGGTLAYGGAHMITFQMLDSNGYPVVGAVTGGAPLVEYRKGNGVWAPVYGAVVYEIGTSGDPANIGYYYFNDVNQFLPSNYEQTLLRVESTVKDASALVRFQIVPQP